MPECGIICGYVDGGCNCGSWRATIVNVRAIVYMFCCMNTLQQTKNFGLRYFLSGLLWPQNLLDGVHEWVMTLSANVPEVVQVKSPNHSTSKVHLPNELGLKIFKKCKNIIQL